MSLDDSDIAAYITKIENVGQELWDSMDKAKGRTTLWEKLPTDTEAGDIWAQFTKIRELAIAFGTKGSKLYQNKQLLKDMLAAIDFMVEVKKYNGVYKVGNWWEWNIGCPHVLNDTLMILSNYTDYENYVKAVNSIVGYAPDVTMDGANRTDIGISILGSAVLAKDDARMKKVQEGIPEVMDFVTSGSGIYKDGSIIQHNNIAYTGSYGNELIKGVGRIQSILAGTPWAMNEKGLTTIYKTISTGYLPLVHKGQMMSMVNGRSISRAPGSNNPFTTEFASGAETICNILSIAEFAPVAYKTEFEAAIKSWLMDSEGMYNFYLNARDFSSLLHAKAIMENKKLEPKSAQGMNIYGSMDRTVQINDKFTAGLSMYSSRTANYECMNGENKKGFTTSDGALFIYNKDLKQFGEGFWPTVDPNRLPGTTSDTRALSDGSGQSKTSPQSWVGGASDGKNGSAGMYLDKTNLGNGLNLRAQKSWFFFDGKIIALGSNINGISTSSIETTIENRILSNDNSISINGKEWTNTDESKNLAKGDYVYFKGLENQNNIGYYFPQEEALQLKKETRKGKYQDINNIYVNDKTYSIDYFKMGIQHGTIAEKDTYEYVLLPGYSEDEVRDFAENNTIEIIHNDESVQALKDTKTGAFAMNVWNNTGADVEGVKVDHAASIYQSVTGGKLTITISDPKQSNAILKLTLKDGYRSVISKDDTVTILEDGSFSINTLGSAGASHTIIVELNVDYSELQKVLEEVKDLQKDFYTSESWAMFKTAFDVAEALLVEGSGASQADIDKALHALLAAKMSLIKADTSVSKAILKSAIDKAMAAETREEFETLAPSVKTLIITTRTAAQVVYADADATNSECLSTWLNLADALHFLDFQADKALLSGFIEVCKVINTDDYQEGVEEFKEALAHAQAVFANDNVLQDTIDAAYDRLVAAKAGLVKNDVVNKYLLEALITFIDGKVGDGSKYKQDANWSAFVKARAEAKAILAKEDATQGEVHNAMLILTHTYESIRLLPSEDQLAELNSFIAVAGRINRADFTEAQLKMIDDTTAKAEGMIKNFDAKNFAFMQKEMGLTLDIIQDVNSNKLADSGIIDKAEGASANTGDRTNAAMLLFAVCISGCAIMIIQRKHNKKA